MHHATLLQCAVLGGNGDLVEFVLGHGADPNLYGPKMMAGRTALSPKPLALACALENPRIIKMLLDAVAQDSPGIKRFDDGDEITALRVAVCIKKCRTGRTSPRKRLHTEGSITRSACHGRSINPWGR